MKNKVISFVAFLVAVSFAQPVQGSLDASASNSAGADMMKDPRDGQEYRTVKIGNATWMAENLSFEVGESWCYTRFGFDCRKYGRFYNWDAAQTVCPAGWHLPTAAEFEQLFADVGGRDSAGVKLKAVDGWNHYGNGSDEYGFNGTPSGFRDYRGRFDRQTLYAYLWSATEEVASQESAAAPSKKAIGIHMMAGRKDVSVYPYPKDFAISVRCVKNAP